MMKKNKNKSPNKPNLSIGFPNLSRQYFYENK